MKYSLEKTLDAHKNSTARTRKIFLIINLTSILLLVSLFNYKWSWKNFEAVSSDTNYFTYEFHERHIDKAFHVKKWLLDSCGKTNPKLDYVVSTLSDNSINAGKSLEYLKVSPKKGLEVDDKFLIVDLPALGIKIYVQDIPLLGGFAVCILLTWYFYARRREKGFVKKLLIIAKDDKKQETKDRIHEELSDNSIFNVIHNVDEDKQVLLKGVSDVFVWFLIFCPVILMGFYEYYDVKENLFCGASHQKYLILNKEVKLIGSEIDYYQRNFQIPDTLVKHNVSTLKFINILIGNNESSKEVNKIIVISMIFSAIFYFICLLQTYNIIALRKGDEKYTNEIRELNFDDTNKSA